MSVLDDYKTNLHNLNDAGLSLIPIREGKKIPHPICLDKDKKHNLLYTRATPEEVEKWLEAGVKSWAIAGGKVSGNLVTLDFDEKHYPGLYDLWYTKLSDDQKIVVDACHKISTRNKGTHIRYRTENSQPTIKLASRVEFNKETKEEGIVTTAETKAEKGYALIPPSAGYTNIQGSLLNLPLVTDEMHEEFIDLMRVFNEVEDEPATVYEYSPDTTSVGDRPGDRFNASASWADILVPSGWVEEYRDHWRRPGKKDGEGISATTNYDSRPMFYVFSTAAMPFKEKRGYSKFHTYALLYHNGDFSEAAKELLKKESITIGGNGESKSEKGSQADKLIEIIETNNNIVLFHDEFKQAYITIPIDDHQETWRCSSNQLKNWLSKVFWDKYKKAPNSDALNTALNVIKGKAGFEGTQIDLFNRVAWKDKSLWYDLAGSEWKAVKITEEGWSIVNNPPIIFRRYGHQYPQVTPQSEGNVKDILKYVNITDPDQQILFLVWMISCFIPDYPHPVPYIYGPQGSAKSTISKIVREFIDPSLLGVASFPKNETELVQILSHNWMVFFDNVSSISEEISDMLCKAVTGGGFSKRELYTDDDDIIYSFKRCIGINGINLMAIKPDLLERSILFELSRVTESDRKQEKELLEEFKIQKPTIMGAIFDALVKAIKLRKDIKLAISPRMADFAAWGCAIAESIGYSQQDFLGAYNRNINNQNKEILYEDPVASLILEFMEDREEWGGTATILLRELTFIASDAVKKILPKAPNQLSRILNQIKSNLEVAFIRISKEDGKQRRIIIKKFLEGIPVPEKSVQATMLPLSTDDKHDEDDDSGNILERSL